MEDRSTAELSHCPASVSTTLTAERRREAFLLRMKDDRHQAFMKSGKHDQARILSDFLSPVNDLFIRALA
jgi:hypothetical protein